MSPSGPRAVEIILSGEERAELSRWAAGAVSSKLAERARIKAMRGDAETIIETFQIKDS